MRRFHNPRFAPESLERKLNPSGITPVPVAVEVHVLASHAGHATQAPTVVTYPGSHDGTMAPDDDGSTPTDPTDTGVPTGGTDPAPPPGDGSPPPIPPSNPSGPILPSSGN